MKYTHFEKAFLAAQIPFLDIETFWKVCPFTIEELKTKSRKQKIVTWRYIAMFFDYNERRNMIETSNRFNLTHASIINGFKRIQNIKTDYLMREAFNDLKRCLK